MLGILGNITHPVINGYETRIQMLHPYSFSVPRVLSLGYTQSKITDARTK